MPRKQKGTLYRHGSNPPQLTPEQARAAREREADENARWTRELSTALPADESNISEHLPLSHRGNPVFLIQAKSGDKYVVYLFPHYGVTSKTDLKRSNQAIAEILIAFKKTPHYKSANRIPDTTLKFGFGYVTRNLYEVEGLFEIMRAQHDLMTYKPPTIEDANAIINFFTVEPQRAESALGSRSSASSGFISPAPSSEPATPSPRPMSTPVSASPVPPSSTPELKKPPKPPSSPITTRKKN